MSYTVDGSGIVRLDGKIIVLPASSLPKFAAVMNALLPLINSNARRVGVLASTIAGIIWAETGFLGPVNGAKAVSASGAIGRMQLMPFWFNKPNVIGDGKAHNSEEMMNDALNLQFGSDLIALIAKDGNDLPKIASIYNCGSSTGKHPWTPHPSPPYVGRAVWGFCAQLADDGLSYIDHVVAASNSFLSMSPSSQPSSGGPSVISAVAIGVGTVLAVRAFLR